MLAEKSELQEVFLNRRGYEDCDCHFKKKEKKSIEKEQRKWCMDTTGSCELRILYRFFQLVFASQAYVMELSEL